VKSRPIAVELLAGLRTCLGASARDAAPMEALARLVADVPTRTLAAVDEVLRDGFSEYVGDGWPHIELATLLRFRDVPRAWGVMAVASAHRSGYIREAAVRGLATCGDGRAIRFLVLRLNDWVDQVRAAARAALDAFLKPALAPDAIAALPLVEALSRQRRGDHGDVVARVLTFLKSPECAPALRAGCRDAERDTRRACLELELANGRTPPPEVFGEALLDREPAVRLWAARGLARAFPAPWAEALARRALGDRSVQIRRVALTALATSLSDEQAKTLFERALLDTNTTARWQGRIFMLQRGPFDLAAFYRRALATATQPAVVRGALFGLGESGTVDDVALVLPFMSSDRLGVRCAALRARAELEPASSTAPYLAALRLPEASVSREARRALETRLSYVAVATLRALVVDQSLPTHTRRNALALTKNKSKWERLPILLEACADGEEQNAKMALLLLEGWCDRYNRSFLQPTPEQIADAKAALALVPRRLRSRAFPEIESVLSVFSRGL
jgi:HEAT repeat protein